MQLEIFKTKTFCFRKDQFDIAKIDRLIFALAYTGNLQGWNILLQYFRHFGTFSFCNQLLINQLSFVILAFCASSRSVTNGLRAPTVRLRRGPHVCFRSTLNAELMGSQWQHRTWTVSLHTPVNAEHEVGQGSLRYGPAGNRAQTASFGGACSANCTTCLRWLTLICESC